MVVPCGHPQIVVRNEADLPQVGRRSSARVDTNFLRIRVENGGNQNANFMHNNAERLRETSQASFKLSL